MAVHYTLIPFFSVVIRKPYNSVKQILYIYPLKTTMKSCFTLNWYFVETISPYTRHLTTNTWRPWFITIFDGEDATGFYCVETRDTATHLTLHRTAPKQNYLATVSIVPGLKNSALKGTMTSGTYPSYNLGDEEKPHILEKVEENEILRKHDHCI